MKNEIKFKRINYIHYIYDDYKNIQDYFKNYNKNIDLYDYDFEDLYIIEIHNKFNDFIKNIIDYDDMISYLSRDEDLYIFHNLNDNEIYIPYMIDKNNNIKYDLL